MWGHGNCHTAAHTLIPSVPDHDYRPYATLPGDLDRCTALAPQGGTQLAYVSVGLTTGRRRGHLHDLKLTHLQLRPPELIPIGLPRGFGLR